MKTASPILTCLLWIAALESSFCLPPQDKEGGERTVATVNGTTITESDLNIGPKLMQLEQEAYQLRLEALQEAIDLRLLEQEAKEQNASVEELLEKNVDAKVSDPSLEEVEAFYERQKSRINKPLDEVRPQVESFVKQMKRQEVRGAYLAKLREGSDVRVLLEAPRVVVEIGDAPQRGPAEAPVTIVEFSDFQCPFCRRAQSVMGEIQEKYPDQVKFVYKDLPLREIHPQAQQAAEAAHCAGDQGKYWEYHEELFSAARISEDSFPNIASSLELDPVAFQQCLDSRKHQSRVDGYYEQAMELGATSTPTFFVNGIQLRGAQPLESFAKIIDAELAAPQSPSQ